MTNAFTPDLSVRDTTHGKGVFTKKDFHTGDTLMQFTGEFLTFDQIPEGTDFEDHCLQIKENLYIGPSGGLDDFVNHSCDPNAGLKIADTEISLVAIKEIAKEEEVTWDYSTTMAEDMWEMECKCESALCRKKIRDFKHLPKDIQEKYITLGIVPEFIIKRVQK